MQNASRELFNQYIARLNELNQVPAGTQSFNVIPSVEQKLEQKRRESVEFLKHINIVQVRDLVGEKVFFDSGNPVSSTTDTRPDGVERKTKDPVGLTARRYQLNQIDTDVHITYAMIDQWSSQKGRFQQLWTDTVNKQVARDMLMMGWNGVSAQPNSDLNTNPLLQDVTRGWLQELEDENPAHVVTTPMNVGPGGDFNNLDAAVYDAKNNLLPTWFRNDPDLVVIIGSDLLTEKYLALLNSHDAPTERNALEQIMLNQLFGGLKSFQVPFFPERSFLITPLSNLSIYWQTGSHRRALYENAKKNQIEDYQSVNRGFVIENIERACLVKSILLPDGNGGWA